MERLAWLCFGQKQDGGAYLTGLDIPWLQHFNIFWVGRFAPYPKWKPLIHNNLDLRFNKHDPSPSRPLSDNDRKIHFRLGLLYCCESIWNPRPGVPTSMYHRKTWAKCWMFALSMISQLVHTFLQLNVFPGWDLSFIHQWSNISSGNSRQLDLMSTLLAGNHIKAAPVHLTDFLLQPQDPKSWKCLWNIDTV